MRQHLRSMIHRRAKKGSRQVFLLFLASLFLGFVQNETVAQELSFNNTVPADMQVCNEGETFTVEFTNISGGDLTGVSINLQLPAGINYVEESLNEQSSFNVLERDVSDLNNVLLSANNLPSGQSITFQFEAQADFTAYNRQKSGATFTNTVAVSYDGGNQSETTTSYNILYAALSITNVTPMATSVFVGGSYTRSVTIVNGGYGSLSSFVLEDTHDSNSTISAVDLGSLNSQGTEITFSSADFVGVGNGDAYFDQNESITVTQTVSVSGCSNFQTRLTAIWGCGGETTISNKKYPFTTVVLYAPDLSFNPTPSFNTCVDGSADQQVLNITNDGTGPANQLSVEISPDHNSQYTRSDINSITFTNSTGTISLSPTSTQDAVGYSCLGSTPKDGFTVSLPAIQPGETVQLKWDNYTCATTYCGDVRYLGWDFEANYTDMCNRSNYKEEDEGQAPLRKKMTSFVESPSDLVDNQEGLYNLIIQSAYFKMPEETGAYFEVAFDIPNGLIWNGTELDYQSGITTWAAESVNYDSSTRKLTATYELPKPDGFNYINSIFELPLTADCSAGVRTVSLGMQFFYIMDPSCNPAYQIPMTCYETAVTQLHCPGSCAHGLSFQSFDVERLSLGVSDNDLDGLPDATNALNSAKIKTNRVMVSDTFKTVFQGTINTSTSFPTWSYAYARSEVPYGDEIQIIYASVEITDASTSRVLNCNQVRITESLSGGVRTVDFDFSPSTLNAAGCTDFAGFVLEDEDDVVLTAVYEVASNPGGMTEQVTITNDFYVSDQPNGNAYQCNDWNGNFTLIGYSYAVNRAEQYNFKTCTKTISQNFKMSIGTCCINYAGGNIFPYEYRNWGHINQLRVEIPAGYTYVDAEMMQWRTRYTGSTVKETSPIQLGRQDGNTLYFDLADYYTINGGNINLSDDGFNGRVSIELQPNCSVNESANSPMTWYFNFNENAVLGGNTSQEYTSSPDYLKYYQADLDLSSTLPTQEATDLTASWDVKVKCTNADAENGWLHFDYNTNDMRILEVRDVDNDVLISSVNGLYPLGNMGINNSKNIRLTVDYSTCNLSSMKVISGYDCNGYPASYADYECSEETLMLYLEPQPAELQVKFNSQKLGNDDCSDSLAIELEMLSAKLSAVKDLFVHVTPPAARSIDIIPGSTEALYPIGGSFSSISDPLFDQGKYVISGANIDTIIGNEGLVGITDLTANIAKLKFNLLLDQTFKPGDFLNLAIGGTEPCGDPLPTLSLIIDPNASFTSPDNIGLGETADDWAVAWADYNQDGFVDLFVTDYEATQANQLYLNDRDGTFTKVTSGAIATDQTPSLSATWGDYDNDGDPDLFVANNIGYKNNLYRNNGNGTFTKIVNDPIVNYDGYCHGAAWADYDNDGFLDLFVSDFFSTKFNQLYHNNGDGTFTSVNSSAPGLEANSSVSGVWGDYNGDGLADLFVSNTNNEPNSLYKNLGNGGFEKITTGAIVEDGGMSVGASWADYDNDGDIDLFVANAGNQDNFLYNNNGDGTFTAITSGNIVNDGGHSHGSAWADYDNDGDVDLFVSNDNDQSNFLYANNGDGSFTKLSNKMTEDLGTSFGAAWADIDNDLDVDLYVANRDRQKDFIYVNGRGKCQNKACVSLIGSNSNKSAIGTKIRLKANIYGQDVWQMRELSTQTGGGVGGQNDLKSIFGLGDASIIDSLIIEWNSGYTQVLTNQSINECHSITENRGGEICGTVYYDRNNNCSQDADEIGIPNMQIVIQPGDLIVTTDEDGNYSAFTDTGSFTVTQSTNALWVQSCNRSYTVDVLQLGNRYCGNHFANTPVTPEVDLSVKISKTPNRIGFKNLVALTYCNEGTETANNVILDFKASAPVTLLESSIRWDSYENGIARWRIDSLNIQECVTIFMKDSIDSGTEVGTPITMIASIAADETESNTTNNLDSCTQEAVGAFDPNDILVSPEGYIDADQELIYTIRFQNVGNASVSTVRIVDEIPADLDMESFEMGVASHTYKVDIEDGNIVTWTFENINMPDSASNVEASQGYLIFKIKPKSTVEDGFNIENKASIFFDFNDPIQTNTVVNTIGEEPETTIAKAGHLQIHPNPSVGEINFEIIDIDNTQPKIRLLQIFDLTGRPVLYKASILDNRYKIDKGVLAPGYYQVLAKDEKGKGYLGKLIVQ